jgi:hypothetical protein
MKADRRTLSMIDPMDRFKRPMTTPVILGLCLALGLWVQFYVIFAFAFVPWPPLVALLPAALGAGIFWWFKSRGFVAVTEAGLVVNSEIYRWGDITKVTERHKGPHDSAALGGESYGAGETFYFHTLYVGEGGRDRVIKLPSVQGSDALRVEIASRLTEEAFAASSFTTWLERRTIKPTETKL